MHSGNACAAAFRKLCISFEFCKHGRRFRDKLVSAQVEVHVRQLDEFAEGVVAQLAAASTDLCLNHFAGNATGDY